ncbi:PAS domain S-box protein [Mucilaginibacter sp. RS28]|uniref:histidine kinase n=1 Tax=Mucilaginibacter straminoryzae TaxID=2932774 RepID=A0A9X2B9U0_9SPHI|nr:PAS domain S-box protein [Mucilaginibacter straminoryzae]MCJ8211034.1 PAS domain S-box protein [Mucilaginibacter straminoryzae]
MGILWQRYTRLVAKRVLQNNQPGDDIAGWQNQLFCYYITICVPASLIALIPGLILTATHGFFKVAVVDITCFIFKVILAFSSAFTIRQKKIGSIIIAYILAATLIFYRGYQGVGDFYLFIIPILAALILSRRFAWLAVLSNLSLILGFALLIERKIVTPAADHQYTAGLWIARNANLLFIDVVFVGLIAYVFRSLHENASRQYQLRHYYYNLFEASPSPMWVVDPDTGNFLDVNNSSLDQYGYERSEFLNLNISAIRTADSDESIQQILAEIRLTGHFSAPLMKHRKKDGNVIDVRIDCNLIDYYGKPACLVLARDITEQRAAEKRTSESEFNLRAILDSSLQGYTLLDRQGYIKAFNSKVFDFSIDQNTFRYQIGKHIFEYMEAERQPAFKQMLEKAYRGEIVEYDREYPREGMPSLWINYMLTPVIEAEQVVGACLIGRDISQIKNHIHTIEEQNKLLMQISWTQSHLVRAPLVRLLALADLLRYEQVEDEQRKMTRFIHESAQELDQTIQKIASITDLNRNER